MAPVNDEAMGSRRPANGEDAQEGLRVRGPRRGLSVAVLVSVIASTIVTTSAPARASSPAITWQGTIDVSGGGTKFWDETYSSSWSYSGLVPMGDSTYAADSESSGSFTRQEWCATTEEYLAATYSWDFVAEADTSAFPELSLVTGDAGTITVALTITDTGAGTTRNHACGSATSEPIILADAFGFDSAVDFGTLSDSDPDPLRVLGSGSASWVDPESGVDLSYSVTADLVGTYAGCLSQPDDDDGDRLPNDYETGRIGSDPDKCDTDEDTYWDAIEVASGSSPTSASETPDTLSGGVAPGSLTGRGDAGVTCGRNKFAWVSPALQSLGGAKGKRGCIFLFSNATANGIVDLALSGTKDNITQVLASFVGPHLLEVYGEEALDWSQEAVADASVWAAKSVAKRAMLRAFNLTRVNGVFTVGKIAALAGVTYGAFWALNQVRNNDACIQVRVGETAGGESRLSWSLVYSAENLTSEGLKDGLHEAGVWKKKVVDFGVDRAIRRSINLSCRGGKVRAMGGSAGEVFEAPTSFIF
jgi:hypothetical protein